MLPGSRWLAFVAEGHRTPRNAILFVWAISSAVVLGLPTLDIITQISAVAGYLGYAGIVIAALCAPTAPPGDGFRLGRARRWIGVGGFSVQPSEWVKIVFVLYLARSSARRELRPSPVSWRPRHPLRRAAKARRRLP